MVMKPEHLPRLIAHEQSQIDYYERQLEAAYKSLGKLMLINQLQFDYENQDRQSG